MEKRSLLPTALSFGTTVLVILSFHATEGYEESQLTPIELLGQKQLFNPISDSLGGRLGSKC
jgi:hypothetical protein